VSTQTNRLGKGLDALIPNIMPNTNISIENISVDLIQPNPYQPRQIFNPEALDILAQSIKTHGLAQPVIVRKFGDQYELIVGERRLEATKIIGNATIPAIVKNITDKESCELSIVENIDREDLNIIEVAHSFKRLLDDFEYTQETLSDLFSRSRSSIANILRLLKLPESVQDMVSNGDLTEGHARTLIDSAKDEASCVELANKIINENLTVRQSESLVRKLKSKKNEGPKQLNLFENYIEQLSQRFKAPVEIKHKNNKLTISLKYDRFKDYIDFLDKLCKF
jgi:ParB family chromosome partitioning protein